MKRLWELVAFPIAILLLAKCTQLPTESCAPPAIATQPVAVTITAPATATFVVAASGAGPFTYQWQRANPGHSTFANVTTGAGGNADSYTTAATTVWSDSGARYQCVITSGCGAPATTTPALLTVQRACVPPGFVTSPVVATVAAPATATFSVVTSGTGPFVYRWQRAGPGSSVFADVADGTGGNAASYTTAPTTVSSDSGATYQCVVTGQCAASATTAPVMLTVVAGCAPPGVATPPETATVAAPATATFSVVASGTGPFAYRWQRANPGESMFANVTEGTGANTASYTTAATTVSSDSGAMYRCVVIGQCDTPATTAPVVLTVRAPTITDTDGNIYHAVPIGSQVWMVENLKTTHYNDGSPIPIHTGTSDWVSLTTAGYCWYNNDSASFGATYGALYNWYAVNTGKLAPKGWHVPTDSEWSVLEANVGSNVVAGGILKETGTTHWLPPNSGATDAYGFAALGGGYRAYDGSFTSIRDYGTWWSANTTDSNYPWYCYIIFSSAMLYRSFTDFQAGFSVRCVRDP